MSRIGETEKCGISFVGAEYFEAVVVDGFC